MTEVIIDTIRLILENSVEQVRINTLQGAAGNRGNYIYSNTGHPDTMTQLISGKYYFMDSELEINDTYLRIDTKEIMQWKTQPGGPAWVQIWEYV